MCGNVYGDLLLTAFAVAVPCLIKLKARLDPFSKMSTACYVCHISGAWLWSRYIDDAR